MIIRHPEPILVTGGVRPVAEVRRPPAGDAADRRRELLDRMRRDLARLNDVRLDLQNRVVWAALHPDQRVIVFGFFVGGVPRP